MLTYADLCVGAGGMALGLEGAGLQHGVSFDSDPACVATVSSNRTSWQLATSDFREQAQRVKGVDVLSAGLPAAGLSVASNGADSFGADHLLPAVTELCLDVRPRVLLVEMVRGVLQKANGLAMFDRAVSQLQGCGYSVDWVVLQAHEFGVPQLRPRLFVIAMHDGNLGKFRWPIASNSGRWVGEALYGEMSAKGWPGAEAWARNASRLAPSIIGGSKQRGGADLGPSGTKDAWRNLGVDPNGIADAPPGENFKHDASPRLTNAMVAELQGFPMSWKFPDQKTTAFRQIASATPPPVGQAVGLQIRDAFGDVTVKQRGHLSRIA